IRSKPHSQVSTTVLIIAGGQSDLGADAISDDGGTAIDSGAASDGGVDSGTLGDLAQAPIVARSVKTGYAGGVGTISIDSPVSMPGDVLIAVISLGNSNGTTIPTLTPPMGWTQIDQINYSTVSYLWVYWRVAGSVEPATTIWNCSDTTAAGVGWITAFE